MRLVLYAIYQRTQSESKSQLLLHHIHRAIHCMQSIKELNLKANHNQRLLPLHCKKTVCNLSKNSIWKQITTRGYKLRLICKLYAIYQRTQSESKSQQYVTTDGYLKNCMQSIKELNLKANHNLSLNCFTFLSTVCNLSKNSIWKQITTSSPLGCWLWLLYAIYQRTQSESKSQL